jgi:hypothetical protein
MKHLVFTLALVAFVGSAGAEPLFLDGAATATDVQSGFLGADAFPFAGLSDGDPIGFHFVFDSDAAPVSNDGTTAVYRFESPAGSTVTLGASMVSLDLLTITLSTSSGSTSLEFAARNDALGFSTSVSFLAQEELDLAVPVSLDAYDVTGVLYANSDLNQALLPILTAELTSAAIIPGPGGTAVLAAALAATTRRRRVRG